MQDILIDIKDLEAFKEDYLIDPASLDGWETDRLGEAVDTQAMMIKELEKEYLVLKHAAWGGEYIYDFIATVKQQALDAVLSLIEQAKKDLELIMAEMEYRAEDERIAAEYGSYEVYRAG